MIQQFLKVLQVTVTGFPVTNEHTSCKICIVICPLPVLFQFVLRPFLILSLNSQSIMLTDLIQYPFLLNHF